MHDENERGSRILKTNVQHDQFNQSEYQISKTKDVNEALFAVHHGDIENQRRLITSDSCYHYSMQRWIST